MKRRAMPRLPAWMLRVPTDPRSERPISDEQQARIESVGSNNELQFKAVRGKRQKMLR